MFSRLAFLKSALDKLAPSRLALVIFAPFKMALDRLTSCKFAPLKSAPVRSAFLRLAPVKSAPSRSASFRFAPSRLAFCNCALDRSLFDISTLGRLADLRFTPTNLTQSSCIPTFVNSQVNIFSGILQPLLRDSKASILPLLAGSSFAERRTVQASLFSCARRLSVSHQ